MCVPCGLPPFSTAHGTEPTREQYLSVFRKEPEPAKEKKKAKKKSDVDKVRGEGPAGEVEWPADEVLLASLLRNVPDFGDEATFGEYARLVRDYAGQQPRGLVDVNQEYQDASGRRIGLWWALVKVEAQRGTLGGKHFARRVATLRSVLVQGPGFPHLPHARGHMQQWHDWYARVEVAIRDDHAVLCELDSREAGVGRWLHKQREHKESICADKGSGSKWAMLQRLEPDDVDFFDLDGQWN
eukprot:gene1932-2175_t